MAVRLNARSLVGQAAVPVALVMVAGSAYLLLMASGRVLDARGFAALTSFYLLSNTVGRGAFAVLELELTRAVPRARQQGEAVAPKVRGVARGGLLLSAAVVVLIAATAPLLVRALGSWQAVVLLALTSGTLALSSLVRGPLAGDRHYGLFAGNLVLETVVYLLGAALLLLVGATSPETWMVVLAVGPLVGSGIVLLGPLPRLRALFRSTSVSRVGAATLVAGSSLYLFSQAVWNLGPVLANGRTTDGVVAAAFAASAVLLRAPVMVFPAVQALVLPRLAVRDEHSRVRAGPGVWWLAAATGIALLWLAASVVLVPIAVRAFFAVDATPGVVVLGAVSLSVLIGLVVQGTQTRLLARPSGTTTVAASWATGTIALVAVALLARDAVFGAAIGQLVAAVVVLLIQVFALRRAGGRR